MLESSAKKDRPFCLLDLRALGDAGPVKTEGLFEVNEVGRWDQETTWRSKRSAALAPETDVMVLLQEKLGEMFHEGFLTRGRQDVGAIWEGLVTAMGVAAGCLETVAS